MTAADPAPDLAATVGEAQEWLEGRMYGDGAECPVCTQFVKVYRRSISAPMAVLLIEMHRRCGTAWCDVPTLAGGLSKRSTGGDEAKLRYWGLIEPMPDARRQDGSTRTGWWRITAAGVAFVERRATVQKYALIYDGRCLDTDGEQVSIADCLGERFSYRDLMAGV